MSLLLIIVAVALMAASGAPGIAFNSRRGEGQRIATSLTVVAAALGLAGAVGGLGGDTSSMTLAGWFMGGGLSLGLDGLSAFFLVPVFLVGGLGSVYGLAYWRQAEHPRNGQKLRLFWGLLIAGMATLVVARHAILFLLGWEVMALSAFFLIGTEDDLEEVRRASWVYLLATHVGTLALFCMFAAFRIAAGSFELRPLGVEEAGLGVLTVIFVLALVGFGLKAGVMPLHFWLPSAHAAAPSHVSALMSGVVIKMGIYGLLRLVSFLPQPPVAWGAFLLIAGAVSGVLGVAFAIGQHDLKRLLAYHSVENIGIIVMGLGLAMIGRSLGRDEWVVLGMAGCLLHVWNHALFKSLLFLCAGSVVHTARTREIDRLGGLARAMPYTAGLFLIGAVAICGLPPLNGFVSELFIYLGLFRAAGAANASWAAIGLAAPVLAIIGALAIACFVKVFGAAFLGLARSKSSAHAHESAGSMLLAMAAMAACCVVIGAAPVLVAPALTHAVSAWVPASRTMNLTSLAPLTQVGFMAGVLLLLVSAGYALLGRQSRAGIGTWDCGYALPTSRMQYSASSFAQMLVKLANWILRPRIHRPAIEGIAPAPSRFESHVEDPVLDRHLMPTALRVGRWIAGFKTLQQGLTQHYILYILATVVAMLLWAMPVGQILTRLLAR